MNNSHQPTPVVINWHLTEGCNFSCQYCYAHWERTDSVKDLIRDDHRVRGLLTELGRFFQPNDTARWLGYSKSSARLNIAGGEPLLFPSAVRSAVHHAREVGFRVSLITNGSLLTEELCHELAPKLDILGVSIDSGQSHINNLIGRVDNQGRFLDLDALGRCFDVLRNRNPSLMVKLNTVVNRRNWEDDLSAVLDQIQPEKWKILRALPVTDRSQTVTQSEFQSFVDRHSSYRSIAVVEDNQDMVESYIMVDPQGRFFQNSPCSPGYEYSQPILEAGAEAAFDQVNFDVEKFCSRYPDAGGDTA